MTGFKAIRSTVCAAVIAVPLLASTPAIAVPLPFDVVDVYSSYKIEYFIAGSGATQTFYEVSRSGQSASLGKTFDFGFFSGTRYGEILANPGAGTVSMTSYSITDLLTPAPGASSDFTSFARNQGKDLIVGRFTVPDVGTALTRVWLDAATAGNEGQLFLSMNDAAASYAPDVFTSWNASFQANQQQENETLSFDFAPNSSILFALGMEPGTGISGNFSATNTYSYSDSVTLGQFSLSYGNPVTPVPEPETYALLLAGLSMLGFAARRRKLKLVATQP